MNPNEQTPAITTRALRASDGALNLQIYASTRSAEMAMTPWSEAEKATFLRSQFEAQKTYYDAQFPDAEFELILLDGQPVGRLFVDHRKEEIRLIDIALLPQWRGQGIGERILRGILAEARRKKLVVRIHVEQNNRAMGLYLRLGFSLLEERGVYHLMQWQPQVCLAAET